MKVLYEYLRRHTRNGLNASQSGSQCSGSGSSADQTLDRSETETTSHFITEDSNTDITNNTNNINNTNNTTNMSQLMQHNSQSNNMNNNSHHKSVSQSCHSSHSSSSMSHIISNDCIIINKELGVGEFGVVQQGVWSNEESGKRIQVAIKCLSSERLENNRIEFLKEATIMHSISHEHIVRLYGVVLEPSLMLVTELAPLRSLLECLKEPALISQFPIISLCNFAAQIADGMAYLESKRLIHRDLAARNILVFAKNKVKISDFGLSRALGVGKDYYQTNFNVNLKLPIAWCAPECINYLKFTSQSDVWAYGVTLWEMFSYGFQPWAALTGQQILESIDEPSYQRLEQPECCPKEYYTLMLKCWSHDSNSRPKFSEIVSILPDCKPELVQSVKTSTDSHHLMASSPSKSKKEFLSYKIGDIITVLDKRGSIGATNSMTMTSTPIGSSTSSLSSSNAHESNCNLWKGALNSGKTGYFNPSDCVSYLGQNLPTSSSTLLSSSCSTSSSTTSTLTSTVLQSKFIRGFLDSKNNSQSSSCGSPSLYGSRRRLRPDMISRPQGDLKHTGHVGADGAFFGDVSFLDGKYHQLPKQIVTPYRAQEDSNQNNSSLDSIRKWNTNENKLNIKNSSNCGDNHEYHEISDEDDFGTLESTPFEILDFGPSLVEEVFRELDSIKPDLDNEISESELAINESSINVKNEVREINLKINKEVALASTSKKKQAMVKPISASDQMELDSAIAMAKDIATRSMLTLDNEMECGGRLNDSPKTPNSPNKRKFSFKFSTSKSSPKSERRNFSEETESIGDIIESITPAAKEAYITLVDKGSSLGTSVVDKLSLESTTTNASPNANTSDADDTIDGNPLRMLRSAGIGGVLRAKVRGNRSFSQPRLPTTAQTAGLARVASTRSHLGVPPPVPNNGLNLMNDDNVNNALPLPPRDRSRPMLMPLKTHQRRHPLVIPTTLNGDSYDESGQKRDSSPLRMGPVLKQVSCPQPPAAFLSNYTTSKATIDSISDRTFDNVNTNKKVAPIPPPKPARSYLGDDSFESEMQKALDNIKIGSSCMTSSMSSTDENITECQQSFATKTPSKTNEVKLESNSNLSNESRTSCDTNTDKTTDKITDKTTDRTTDKSNQNIGRIRSNDCDEVRVMQKVLANEVQLSCDECAAILHSTDWDVHRAIKCIRLRQQLRSHNIDVDCNWAQMLSKFNWNIRQASNYLIATQGVPEDTTEV